MFDYRDAVLIRPASLLDPSTRLVDVTFVVVDLETTGGSPWQCGITEIGAVKVRGGEHLGSFRTFVNPGSSVPAGITALTGISNAMVEDAPPVRAVMPAFIEFVGSTVIVGHNVRFDLAFLHAAAEAAGYGRFNNHVVDTCLLARRLVADEVDDCKLITLARRFRTATTPSHRALADAEATTELLHALLERAATLGTFELGDLLDLPRTARHPEAAKLKLVAPLPHAAGVYVLRDRRGNALYAGRAADIRRRVRSLFRSPDKRRVAPLLHETDTIDTYVCPNALATAIVARRAVHAWEPTYNRNVLPRAKRWFVSVGARRPVITRRAEPSSLGPMPHHVARAVRQSLLEEPSGPSSAELTAVLARRVRDEQLRSAGCLVVPVPGDGGIVVDAGVVVAAWAEGGPPAPLPLPPVDDLAARADEAEIIAAVASYPSALAAACETVTSASST